MIQDWQQRTELLLGSDRLERYAQAHVLVVGVGGVGAYAAEMLCRAGIGHMTIADADTVQPSNINRQLPATHSVIGMKKTEVLAQRLRDINPQLQLTVIDKYITEEDVPSLLDAGFDFVADAIDTIAPKCALITECARRKIKIISSMGAGAKTDITQIKYADIADTYNCGLSKAVRQRLKKSGMRIKLPVVFSSEPADRNAIELVNEQNKKSTTGTICYMPAMFGCYIAAYILKKI